MNLKVNINKEKLKINANYIILTFNFKIYFS